jgi:hypothetical protein
VSVTLATSTPLRLSTKPEELVARRRVGLFLSTLVNVIGHVYVGMVCNVIKQVLVQLNAASTSHHVGLTAQEKDEERRFIVIEEGCAIAEGANFLQKLSTAKASSA